MKTQVPPPQTILFLERDPELGRFWKEALQEQGFRIVAVPSLGEAEAAIGKQTPDLVFLGTGFPDEEISRLLAKLYEQNKNIKVLSPKDQAHVREELLAMKERVGPDGGGGLKVEGVEVAIREPREAKAGVKEAQTSALAASLATKIRGESDPIQRLRAELLHASATDETIILLRGETGTGKGLAARAIHELSARRAAPFVEMNCTAIPEALLESELFGHEAGAFTDARSAKTGLFEAADRGTIFLDEIGDMGWSVQTKLLKVLEDKEVRRVGATKPIGVNVRVIAATHQPLEQALREKKFREDLYFRLNVFPIFLPPLRACSSDIILLARHFIDEFNRGFHKEIQGLTFTAEKKLLGYLYPGNVRELRNLIERAVILETGKFLSPENIVLDRALSPPHETEQAALPEDLNLEAMEQRMIQEALQRAGGNQSEAARLLHISRFALRNRMKQFHLL